MNRLHKQFLERYAEDADKEKIHTIERAEAM